MSLPISIHGARCHNLQNVSLTIPTGRLIVLTGPSGAGKSSLALDTLFAESRRRFLDCLSVTARQSLQQPDKPLVDSISGLPPALCLEQGQGPPHAARSVLGGMTEILDYLRIYYAAAGIPHDPVTGTVLERKTSDQIVTELVQLPERTRLSLLAPVATVLSQDVQAGLGDFQRQGFLRMFWNNRVVEIADIEHPAANPPADAALVIDRIMLKGESSASRVADSIQTALRINGDEVRALIVPPNAPERMETFHTRYRNPVTGFVLPQLTPKHFSFHSPLGACPACQGSGGKTKECRLCHGTRLNPVALAVTVTVNSQQYNLAQLSALSLEQLAHLLPHLPYPAHLAPALEPVVAELQRRVSFLNKLGLAYLSLDRPLHTLSGGELQRSRLAGQMAGNLAGVLYILDEPTSGLHPTDVDRLLLALRQLRDQGNTVLVVEHDSQVIQAADYVIDMGPGAGPHGGKILAAGDLPAIMQNTSSPTGQWLKNKQHFSPPVRKTWQHELTLSHINKHNLHQVCLHVPLGVFTCIAGPSGSGKSTLILDCLVPALKAALARKPSVNLQGSQHIDRLIVIDQSPMGKSLRSTPATATGLLNVLRPLYARLPLSRQRGYTAERFSPNLRSGRCERCLGTGVIEVDMNFLTDVILPCDACNGMRYNRETLEITWKGKSIAAALHQSVEQAMSFFAGIPKAMTILRALHDVGLAYLYLDRRVETLSAGELQRIKIAAELAKIPATDPPANDRRCLFVLDEPTAGLHFGEVAMLLAVLNRLRDAGHTVLCIEHNPHVLNAADHIIDMGPGAGCHGGKIMACGTPEQVAANPHAPSGPWLGES